jgi:hypothetical protein
MAVIVTTRVLITEAFRDITVLSPGQPLDDPEASDGLSKLTRLFDNWNAERAGVYASRPTTYTLTADLNPHTIGPAASSPTFTVAQRPVSIDAANLISGDIHYPLNIRNEEWYASLPMPSLATWPSDLWYSADWPLGRLYLYPVPDDDYGLQLWTRIVLADLGLDDAVNLPPGYRDAVTRTLGEMLAPGYPPAKADAVEAAKSRARIFANNDVQPTLATADAGVPRRGGAGWSILNFYRGY